MLTGGSQNLECLTILKSTCALLNTTRLWKLPVSSNSLQKHYQKEAVHHFPILSSCPVAAKFFVFPFLFCTIFFSLSHLISISKSFVSRQAEGNWQTSYLTFLRLSFWSTTSSCVFRQYHCHSNPACSTFLKEGKGSFKHKKSRLEIHSILWTFSRIQNLNLRHELSRITAVT